MKIKRQASFKEFTISVLENNSIEMLVNGKPYDGAVKPLLRDTIAPQACITVEEKWNTQDLGKKMVEYLTNRMEINNFLSKLSDDDFSGDEYSADKASIKEIFKITEKKIDDRLLRARLAIIDEMYSTQMDKRYYALGEIVNNFLAVREKMPLKDAFKKMAKNPSLESEFIEKLWNANYGISKTGDEKGVAVSLISKYAYFETGCKFPIYDTIACEMFPIIWKKVTNKKMPKLSKTDKNGKLNGYETIKAFIGAINDMKEILGADNEDFYDRFDRFMWYLGKIRRGNMSLVLSKVNYKKWCEIAQKKNIKFDEEGLKEAIQKIDANELTLENNELFIKLYTYAKGL